MLILGHEKLKRVHSKVTITILKTNGIQILLPVVFTCCIRFVMRQIRWTLTKFI